MKYAKSLLGGLMVASMLSGFAFAEQIGVVDMQEISTKYAKAQDLAAQVKTREDELQKLRDTLAKQLKAGEKLSPVERKNLEDKLNKQFADKFKEYRDSTVTQETAIKADLDKAIQQVAANQKIDVVLPKQAVLQGGRDITPDVITALNK